MRSPRYLILLGALAQIHIDFIGQIFISELILFLIWTFGKNHLKSKSRPTETNPEIAFFQKLLFCAFLTQLTTDLFSRTNILDIVKGSSLILFTLFNLTLISRLVSQYTGVVEKLLLGYSLSYFVAAFFQPNAYFKNYPWKFGFAYGATLLMLILIQKYIIKSKIFTVLIVITYAVVNLALDTRSLGMVIVIALVIYLTHDSIKKSKIITFTLLLILLILAPTFYSLYISKVSHGSFGIKVQEKYLNQSQNTKNIFFGGRTNVFVGLSQVVKNPIVGQGSYAKITDRNRQEILTEIVGINPNLYSLLFSFQEGDLIPIHSVLLQFWVWYGILGAIPWLWYLYKIALTLMKNFRSRMGITLLNSYLITLTTWDLLFSPFGADRRFTLPLFLITILNSRSNSNVERKL